MATVNVNTKATTIKVDSWFSAIFALNMHGEITYDAIFSVHGTSFAHGV